MRHQKNDDNRDEEDRVKEIGRGNLKLRIQFRVRKSSLIKPLTPLRLLASAVACRP